MKKIIYDSENTMLLPLFPLGISDILDVGCGNGALARAILRDNPRCVINGITYSDVEAKLAEDVITKVWVDDLNTFDFSVVGMYDCIVCSHVLEHLYRPWEVLGQLRTHLKPSGVLIVALPNVLEVKTRMAFLKGRFRYTDWGTLDNTHYRFFDWETAYELIENAGFVVEVRMAQGYCPLPFIRRFLGPVAGKLDTWATRTAPGLWGTQFIFRARPKK
jgi:SAM-dependent methyltransferase